MVQAHLTQCGPLGAASVAGMGTARGKGAAAGQLRQVGRLAFDGHQLLCGVAVQTRHAGHQAPGIGVARVGIQLGRGRRFDHTAGVHHHHAVSVARHHAQVVCDEDERRPRALRQVFQQIKNLRLHGDVQRGGGFIGNDELRLTSQCHGDHGALAHATTELVRVSHSARSGV